MGAIELVISGQSILYLGRFSMIEPTFRTPFSGLIFLVFLVAMLAVPGSAVASEVFTVRGIKVDVTAETAAKARTKALAEGDRIAFTKLIERLTMRIDRELLPEFTAQEISSYIRDFEVADEKNSQVRYLASLNYTFKDADVRGLLQDHQIPFAETMSKPALVVPVYRKAGVHLLWEEDNAWRDAWDALPVSTGLVPMLLPLGDLADLATIQAEQALNGDMKRLGALTKRYGATDSLIVEGAFAISPETGLPQMEVIMTRYGSSQSAQTMLLSFAAQGEETETGLLQRAAFEVAAQIEDHWKRDNLIRYGEAAIASVLIPVRGLGDWIEVRRRLSSIAVVNEIDLVLLSRNEVRVNLHYLGNLAQLALALEQADLRLWDSNGILVLDLNHGNAPTASSQPDSQADPAMENGGSAAQEGNGEVR